MLEALIPLPGPRAGASRAGVTPGGSGSSPERRASGAIGQDQWRGVSVVRCVCAELFYPLADLLGILGIGLEIKIALERIDGVRSTA